MQVVDENLLDAKRQKELKKQREEMAEARQQYEKDLLHSLKAQKLSEERVDELQGKLADLRKANDLRNLEKDKEGSARMDVKAIREKFHTIWPEYQRKQLEMEKLRQDMNKKYVEMHLIYGKYLIDEEQDDNTLGGARANLLNLLNQDDDQTRLQGGGTIEELSKQLEEMKRDRQNRINNLQNIE